MIPAPLQRCDVVLFAASALATAFGLMALPAFDPLTTLLGWSGPWAFAAAALHVGMAWLGCELLLRTLAPRLPLAWRGWRSHWVVRAALGLALLCWLASQVLQGQTVDARALLWLQLMPLLLWASGLLSRSPLGRQGSQTRLTSVEAGQHFRHDTGMMNQVDVRRGGHMAELGPWQAGTGHGKDDVVAVAVTAKEKAAA
jgi:hypothetical protein